MKYLLLVSHGDFSKGLRQTLSMFAGDAINQVIAVGLHPDEAASTFGKRFEKVVTDLPADADFIILTDIIGGSPLTTVCGVLDKFGKLTNSLVIGGMNFPMALTALMSKDTMENDALKAKIFSEATSAIKSFDVTSSHSSDDDDI